MGGAIGDAVGRLIRPWSADGATKLKNVPVSAAAVVGDRSAAIVAKRIVMLGRLQFRYGLVTAARTWFSRPADAAMKSSGNTRWLPARSTGRARRRHGGGAPAEGRSWPEWASLDAASFPGPDGADAAPAGGFSRGGGRSHVEFIAVCVWFDDWLIARETGETEREIAAADMIAQFPTWPSWTGPFLDWDESVTDLLQTMIDAVTEGDALPVTDFVALNCSVALRQADGSVRAAVEAERATLPMPAGASFAALDWIEETDTHDPVRVWRYTRSDALCAWQAAWARDASSGAEAIEVMQAILADPVDGYLVWSHEAARLVAEMGQGDGAVAATELRSHLGCDSLDGAVH